MGSLSVETASCYCAGQKARSGEEEHLCRLGSYSRARWPACVCEEVMAAAVLPRFQCCSEIPAPPTPLRILQAPVTLYAMSSSKYLELFPITLHWTLSAITPVWALSIPFTSFLWRLETLDKMAPVQFIDTRCRQMMGILLKQQQNKNHQ